MKPQLLGVLCVLVLTGAARAGTLTREAHSKTTVDEDTYGELADEDVQQDDYYSESELPEAPGEIDNRDSNNLKIISKSKYIIAKTGDVVRLPCQVSSEIVDPVRIWKRGPQLLFQGSLAVTGDTNLKDVNGTLEVTLKNDEYFGQYNCTLALSEHMNQYILHTVVKTTQPRIISLMAENDRTELSVNDMLALKCNASGVPKPKISWHKNNERLSREGDTLIIEHVSIRDGGSYRCLADNSVGDPAHQHIDIYIKHTPIVTVEKYIVNSDKSSNAELMCHVSAFPRPIVVWQKDGKNVVENLPKIRLSQSKDNHKNALLISSVDEHDFGEYLCVAQNALGKTVKSISLVKIPVVVFQNPQEASKNVVLTYKVESKQPVDKHELQYRKKGENSWKTITPKVINSTNGEYFIGHTLSGLEPGVYETRARSQNPHGWSTYSETMPFQGVLAKHNSHQKAKHHKNSSLGKDAADLSNNKSAQHRSEDSSSSLEASSKNISRGSTLAASLVMLIVSITLPLCMQIRQ